MTTDWKAYNGTDEQIAEMATAVHGWIVRYEDGTDSDLDHDVPYNIEYPTHYWIIPDDPLREMKIRQAQTGRPVWIRYKSHRFDWDSSLGSVMVDDLKTEITTTPDWNIPNAEYSFTPFAE